MRLIKSNVQRVGSMICILALMFSMSLPFSSSASANGFYVNNGKLYDANGNVFVMRGINMAHNWYKSQTGDSIEGIASTGANTVRVVLSNGDIWSRDSLDTINQIIDLCKANNLIAVLEVHDATGKDDYASLDRVVDYWLDMKSALIGNEKYVILNIANEWSGSWDSDNWRDGYVQAVPKLRNAGIQNTIMIDCAGWGQYPQSIFDHGMEVFNTDPDKNIVFSIHMYEYAGGDAATVKRNIDGVINQGLPLVIGEFASYHTNGDVDEQTILNYCQEKGVGYLGWSWIGNSEDLAYLDISNAFSGGNYTEWGNILINGTNGIAQTSNICSIFTGEDSRTEPTEDYIQYYYGSSYAQPWQAAVSVMTDRNGGAINRFDITNNGYFYVKYTGGYDSIELCLQSWSGGSTWYKLRSSESGSSNGVHYAKFYGSDLTSAYGNISLLDQVNVCAASEGITVLKLQYVK